jgi:hypothetical protein
LIISSTGRITAPRRSPRQGPERSPRAVPSCVVRLVGHNELMVESGRRTGGGRVPTAKLPKGEQALREFSDTPTFGLVEAGALLGGVTMLWAAACVFPAGLWWRGTGQAEDWATAFMIPFLLGFACLFFVGGSVHLRVLGGSLSVSRAEALRTVVYSPRGTKAAAARLGWGGRGFSIWWRTLLMAGVAGVVVSGAARAIALHR